MSQWIRALLIASLLLLAPIGQSGCTLASLIRCDTRPCLKINDYTVLYAWPEAPYIDASGTVMAPVGELAKLLGGAVKRSADGKTATVAGNHHTTTFTAKSRWIRIDGKAAFLSSPPIQLKPSLEMLVPVPALAKGMGLVFVWDSTSRMLRISDGMELTKTVSAEWKWVHTPQLSADMGLGNEASRIVDSSHIIQTTPDPLLDAVGFHMTARLTPRRGLYSLQGYFRARLSLFNQGKQSIDNGSVLALYFNKQDVPYQERYLPESVAAHWDDPGPLPGEVDDKVTAQEDIFAPFTKDLRINAVLILCGTMTDSDQFHLDYDGMELP